MVIWGALFFMGGDIFSNYFLVIIFLFLKKLWLGGPYFFIASKFNLLSENGAFLWSYTLISNSIWNGLYTLLAAYLSLKGFSGQPPRRKKEKWRRFFFLPDWKERGGPSHLLMRIGNTIPCIPPLSDYCICANEESLGEYTPNRVK